MALTKDDSSFALYRLILQQAMGAGYRTQSLRQNQLYLKELKQVFENAGEDDLLRKDETERNRYLFRADESHRDANYLFLLYSLCPPGNKNTDFVSAQIMQVLAEAERKDGKALRINAIWERLENRWHLLKGASWTTKLKPCIERMLERGILQTDPKDPRAYQLMPELPSELLDGKNAEQLRRICALIPALSDRCMPESWGYRTKETLQAILEDRGLDTNDGEIRFVKADFRPQLILDDAILWDILSAYALKRWIQVDYRFPSTGHIVRSCRLQPLRVWTNAGEGRSYLVAREWHEENEKETRPVILPLDIIVKVYLLEEKERLLTCEEQEEYWNRWFAHSFSGISAAESDHEGNICEPIRVQVTVCKPTDMTELMWAAHKPRMLGIGTEQEDGSIVYSLQVTRPEDLEPTLIRYDDIIREVKTEGHPFGGCWSKRRKLWHQAGIQTPYPPVDVILPGGQENLEPQWQGLMTPLLHPDMIPRIQDAIRKYNWKIRIKKTARPKEFIPYDNETMIPTRLSWAELDWLERFLCDPLVGSMLEGQFCDKLHEWVRHALKAAEASGYVRRSCGDFLHLNRRIGRTADKTIPSRGHMTTILDGLSAGQALCIRYRTGRDRKRESKGCPVGLEYYQGTGNVQLQLKNRETGAMDKIRCTRILSVETMEGAASEQEAMASDKQFAQLLLPGDSEFRVRALGLLQPYLDSVFEDPYGSMRINLEYPAQEEDLLARFLRLLAPGVLLTEGAPQSLCRKYREMFPLVKCAFPSRYIPAGKTGQKE